MTEINDQFDEFWRVFPKGRRSAKSKAKRMFVSIVSRKHKDLKATPQQLIYGAMRYAMAMMMLYLPT